MVSKMMVIKMVMKRNMIYGKGGRSIFMYPRPVWVTGPSISMYEIFWNISVFFSLWPSNDGCHICYPN